jgi:hypothetical protein
MREKNDGADDDEDDDIHGNGDCDSALRHLGPEQGQVLGRTPQVAVDSETKKNIYIC